MPIADAASPPPDTFDAAAVRREFPVFEQSVHGKPLVYLDSASTTQKPRAVLDAMRHFYETSYANVHRGVHHLSQRATDAYEGARDTVRAHVGAASRDEIIFCRGTTEAINLVAQSWARERIGPGDSILVTQLEHHSNWVPWQMVAAETGATLRVLPVLDSGDLNLEALPGLLDEGTRLVAVTHISNSVGTVIDVKAITAAAKRVGARVLVDGAQALPHTRVDVQDLGCDFYAFSGHKAYGPTGIGALYGRRDLLAEMPPWQGGGDMILSVTLEETEYNELPYKFEAGTPNIAGAVGMAAALEWLAALGIESVAAHESALVERLHRRLDERDHIRRFGRPRNQAAAVSFNMVGAHPHDVGTILDGEGVAVRTGHHCTQPVMDHFDVDATVRASFGVYNTEDDIDRLVAALDRAKEILCP